MGAGGRYCLVVRSSKHPVPKFADPSTEHLPPGGKTHTGILPLVTRSTVVKPERRKRYPPNWEQLAWHCKEQAGWRCSTCKIKHGAQRISKRTGAVYTVYLHAAHAHHDPGNLTPVLLCLCPTCHGRYDHRYRMRQRQITLERLKHQKLLAAVSS
jgi:hypothetical protein